MDVMGNKLLYSMGEVSEMLDVKPSVIRFWESRFDVLKPRKNKKGNRQFSPQDIENLKLIYHLVREQGMTIEGAQRKMHTRVTRDTGDSGQLLTRDTKLLEKLQGIRSLLEEVREGLRGVSPTGRAHVSHSEPSEADAAASASKELRSSARATAESEGVVPKRKRPVEVIEPVTRPAKDVEDKELFAYYEQTLF